MRLIALAVVLGTTLALPAFAQTSGSTGSPPRPPAAATSPAAALSAQDMKFVNMAAAGGMAEVEEGKLAQQKATNSAVKDFARKMVDDHSKANAKLTSIAQAKNIKLPSSIGDEHKKTLSDLHGKRGADFDRAYVMSEIDDHKATIQLFEEQSRSGQDADLKAFATETLPTLKQHLAMVEKLGTQVQVGQRK